MLRKLYALKIDRSRVGKILLRHDARAIVQTIANLATTLGLAIACDGVDAAEQRQAVTALGRDQLQCDGPRPRQEHGYCTKVGR